MLILCIVNKTNVWHLWSLKILAIKRWFPFNFVKIKQGRHVVVGGPKNFKLLPDTFFDGGFRKIVLSSLLLFLCRTRTTCRTCNLQNSRAFKNGLGQLCEVLNFEDIGKSLFHANSLNANNSCVNKIPKTVQCDLTFILNVLSESSIHFF